ncbi:MAG: TolC family protein [Nitrospirales bacterium]
MRGASLLGVGGLVLAFVFAVPAAAEPRIEAGEAPILTMEEAIRIALEQHPRLEQSLQRTLAAQAQTDQAFSSLLPQVQSVLNGTSGSARSNTSFLSGAIIENPNSNQATGGFRLDQLIYDFGTSTYRIQARAFGAEARGYDYLADRAFTVLAVQGAYLTALKQARLMDIAEKAVEERRVIRDLVDALYQAERRSKVDLSLADVEFRNAQLEKLQTRNDYLIAVQQLRTAMGVGGNEPVRLREPVTVLGDLPSLGELFAEAKGLRPELQAVQSRLKSTEAALVSAERQVFPTIQATVSSGETAISDRNGK